MGSLAGSQSSIDVCAFFGDYQSIPLPLPGKKLSFQEGKVLAQGHQQVRDRASGIRPQILRRFYKLLIQGMQGKPPFLTSPPRIHRSQALFLFLCLNLFPPFLNTEVCFTCSKIHPFWCAVPWILIDTNSYRPLYSRYRTVSIMPKNSPAPFEDKISTHP